MKIRDLMSKDVVICHKDTNLAAAGAIMWERDCGFLPVVDEAGAVTGVLTDRDICIALCTRNVRASELTAGDVAVSQVLSCTENEDVRAALRTMRDAKVHRLPVVDGGPGLQGIVSMDDILVCAEKGDGKTRTQVPIDDVLQTLQAISAHHQSRQLVVAAE